MNNKNSKKNNNENGRGRPSGYKIEYNEQVENLAAIGVTEEQMARFFKIDTKTLYRWKKKYPELCLAIKIGKDKAEMAVTQNMYRQAIKDDFKAVTAAIFWLKNRYPSKWQDVQRIKTEQEVEIKKTGYEDWTDDQVVAEVRRRRALGIRNI